MRALVALQTAFVLSCSFVAGLFVATFHRLESQFNGFSPEGVAPPDG